MATIKSNTIFTNVLLKPDKTVWWEGSDEPAPPKGTDWKGYPWQPDMIDENGKHIPGAHPNSRFTVPIKQCPSVSYRIDQHHGVPISAIIFGGRRAYLAPLVYETFNWKHGVFVGATMASERTAAQYGKVGEVRRDPMAMLPFCGYNMGDYFGHWITMGKKMKKSPKIFHVNWFRVDEKGKFMWPGYGENLRIIEWILDRCNDRVPAKKTPIGYVPRPSDIDMTSLNLSEETLKKLLNIDKQEWQKELKDIAQFLKKFGKHLPKEMLQEYNSLAKRLS
jgi:phosphoenolpyruvate carboxykinase (GTP)